MKRCMGEVPDTETPVSMETWGLAQGSVQVHHPGSSVSCPFGFLGRLHDKGYVDYVIGRSDLQPHSLPRGQRGGTESSNPLVLGYSVNHPHP